jgi:hypothetical protein
MVDVLAAVRGGKASLVQAADSLLFLRDAVDERDESWADEFTGHVATLESAGIDAKGNVLGRGGTVDRAGHIQPPGSAYPGFPVAALDALEQLIQQRLAAAPDDSDEAE